MGASQSIDDSDSEAEEGLDVLRQQDEELEQEPEIRPFNYPQSPLEPQESDNLLPVPEPLELSEPEPQLPELGEGSDLPTSSHIFGSDSASQVSDQPAPLDLPEELYSSLSRTAEHVSTSGGADIPPLQSVPDPWHSPSFQNVSTTQGVIKPPESPGLGLGTSFFSMAPLPSHVLSSAMPSPGLSSPVSDEITTEIYVIRHAEAMHNISPLIGGRSPSALLTAKGQQQAIVLGRFLRDFWGLQFDFVYSSPIERARATAVAVCEELGIPEETIQLEADLQELSQGEWEGKMRSEVYVPGLATHMTLMQPDFRAPGGESQRQVEFRMVEFFNNLVRREKGLGAPPRREGGGFSLSMGVRFASHQSEPIPGRNGIGSELNLGNGSGASSGRPGRGAIRIAVFSHGTAIKCLLRGLLGSEPHMTYKIGIDNTSVTVLKHTASRGWHVEKVNDTAHLVVARGQLGRD